MSYVVKISVILKLRLLLTKTKCEKALGFVEFVDIQNAKNNEAKTSPAFSNTTAGFNGAWPFSITSDSTACEEKLRGAVAIEKVSLLFPNLGGVGANTTVAGTLTGKFLEPAKEGKCPAGGISLNEEQTVTVDGTAGTKVKITAGEKGVAAICFVSANNYLFPEKAPTWAPFTGAISKD